MKKGKIYHKLNLYSGYKSSYEYEKWNLTEINGLSIYRYQRTSAYPCPNYPKIYECVLAEVYIKIKLILHI